MASPSQSERIVLKNKFSPSFVRLGILTPPDLPPVAITANHHDLFEADAKERLSLRTRDVAA